MFVCLFTSYAGDCFPIFVAVTALRSKWECIFFFFFFFEGGDLGAIFQTVMAAKFSLSHTAAKAARELFLSGQLARVGRGDEDK